MEDKKKKKFHRHRDMETNKAVQERRVCLTAAGRWSSTGNMKAEKR